MPQSLTPSEIKKIPALPTNSRQPNSVQVSQRRSTDHLKPIHTYIGGQPPPIGIKLYRDICTVLECRASRPPLKRREGVYPVYLAYLHLTGSNIFQITSEGSLVAMCNCFSALVIGVCSIVTTSTGAGTAFKEEGSILQE